MIDGYPCRRFYVAQFGYIWSLTPEAMETVLRTAAQQGAYDLDVEGCKELKGEFSYSKWTDNRGRRPSQIPEQAIILKLLDQPQSWFVDAYAAFMAHDWDTLRFM